MEVISRLNSFVSQNIATHDPQPQFVQLFGALFDLGFLGDGRVAGTPSIYLEQVQDTTIEVVQWIIDRGIRYTGGPVESIA